MSHPPLAYHSLPAHSGKSTSALLLIHGYGDSGYGILSLGAELAKGLPETCFYAPNAPFPFPEMAQAFKWFTITTLEDLSDKNALAELNIAIERLNAFIDYVSEKESIAPANIALFGFSQGAAMVLHVGPRRLETLGGLIGVSGMLMAEERLSEDTQTRPPLFIAHGTEDAVVPFSNLSKARTAFEKAGFETIETFPMQGAGHTITPEALARIRTFLANSLQG